MTVVVTGGAGFIGSNFLFHMLSVHPDYRIVCLDKLSYAGNLSTLKELLDNPNFRKNEDWWQPIITGEYRHYYEKMYGSRGKA